MARRLALIIGNSEYEDTSLSALVTPGADVNALAGVLRDAEVGGFDEVTALVNQPAAVIQRSIAGFFAEREREDLLLLYFSGHGVRDERGQLFLAAKDTEHRLLRGTAIPSSFITEEMDSSRSRRQVLILDCCHSGAFSRGMKGTPGASVGTAVAFEGTGSGRVVLTATDSTQYAWEGDQVVGQAENSVFTHYLIQGLRTGAADTDSDGRITLDELYDYVYDLVVNETPRQTPSKWSYGQQGEIVLARNPRPVVKPAELPTDLQESIEDPRPWVRESALRELDRLMRGSHRGLALAGRRALERLTEDDSRRVAAAAEQALAAFPEPSPPVVPAPEPARAPSESRMLFERISGNEAKPEIRAISSDSAMESRVVSGQPKAPIAVAQPPPRASEPGLMQAFARLINTQLSRLLLVLAAGWGLGGLLGIYWSWTKNPGWGLAGFALIPAATTGLVLWDRRRRLTWVWIAVLCAAFALAWMLFDRIDAPAGDFVSGIFGNLVDVDISWKLGWWFGFVLAGLLSGAVAGLAIALGLRQRGLSLSKRSFWNVVFGWALAITLFGLTGEAFGERTNWESLAAVVVGYGIGGLIGGAIGGLIMFSQSAKSAEAENSRPSAARPTWIRWISTALDRFLRQSVLVTGLGWALGWILHIYWAWTRSLPWALAGQALILGGTLGLVLWYRNRTFKWTWFGLLFAAAATSAAIWDQIHTPVAYAASSLAGSLLDVELVWKLGRWLGLLLAGLGSGSLLGGAVMLALGLSGLSVSRRSLFFIFLGWMAGFALMNLIGNAFGERTDWESLSAAVLGFGLGGLIGGALGSLIMFSQLAKRPEAENPLSPVPSS